MLTTLRCESSLVMFDENMLACFPKRSRLSLIKILLLQHTRVLIFVSVRVCLPESPFTSSIESSLNSRHYCCR